MKSIVKFKESKDGGLIFVKGSVLVALSCSVRDIMRNEELIKDEKYLLEVGFFKTRWSRINEQN